MDDKTPKDDKFVHGIKIFLAVMMFMITAVTFYQIIMRYVFRRAPYWSEELVRFTFVWITLIGAAIGIREKIHIGIDLLVARLPEKWQKYSRILVNCAICFFAGFIIYYGYQVSLATLNQPSPALKISMSYVYAGLPVGGALMIYFAVKEIINEFKNKPAPQGEVE